MRTIFKISVITQFLLTLPLVFILKLVESSTIYMVLALGVLAASLFTSLIILQYMHHNDLFKKIDALQDERQAYRLVKAKYLRKMAEYVESQEERI
jgi:hypothetical protein